MRITSKGQLTIPQHVREELGLLPGTDVDVVIRRGNAEIVKTVKSNGKMTRGERLVANAIGKGTANTDLTTDQIMAWTRGWDDIDDPDR